MLGHSVSYYLPKYWATTPLYSEKIIPLLDHMLSVGSPDADKLALAYYDIWNKYTNPEDMTDESIKAYVQDHGYTYILDLLATSHDNLQNLLFLLPLITYLKGSRKGLEVVFSLLQNSGSQSATNISVWHEQDPIGEEDTFSIESDIDLASIDTSFSKIRYIYTKVCLSDINRAFGVLFRIRNIHTSSCSNDNAYG